MLSLDKKRPFNKGPFLALYENYRMSVLYMCTLTLRGVKQRNLNPWQFQKHVSLWNWTMLWLPLICITILCYTFEFLESLDAPRDALMWPCVKLHFPASQLWGATKKLKCYAALNPVTFLSDQPVISSPRVLNFHCSLADLWNVCVFMYERVISDQKSSIG